MRVSTTDLYESSYLHCCGVELIEAIRDSGELRPTVVFVFDGGDELEQLQRDYRTGDVVVPLTAYRRSMMTLKRIMFKALDTRPKRERRKRQCSDYPRSRR